MQRERSKEWGLQFCERVVGETLDVKVVFEQRPVDGEGMTHIIVFWGKEFRQKKQQVQRSWGRREPNQFKQQQGKQNG